MYFVYLHVNLIIFCLTLKLYGDLYTWRLPLNCLTEQPKNSNLNLPIYLSRWPLNRSALIVVRHGHCHNHQTKKLTQNIMNICLNAQQLTAFYEIRLNDGMNISAWLQIFTEMCVFWCHWLHKRQFRFLFDSEQWNTTGHARCSKWNVLTP